MTPPLTFISPAIIERIENGSFVPARHAKPDAPTDSQHAERRNILSPLAVTKRCIRYEPRVFEHRKSYILQMARSLNQPETKIVLLAGPQGTGKTSLTRGLIEVMGSKQEQLLWFDVNRHSDFEEIIQFLIQYITYVCANVPGVDFPELTSGELPEEPLKRLELLISRVASMPLLLVLDNVEYIVDAELRFNSYPFKEMLNFLLAFPNIKMVLIGERLPYGDMSPNQAGITDIRLEGLREADAVTFLESLEKPRQTRQDAAILEQVAAPAEAERGSLRQLFRKTEGQPWLLKIAYYLSSQAHLDFYTLNRLLDSMAQDGAMPKTADNQPVAELATLIYQRLPEQHRRLFQVLAFLRHPVDLRTLLSLTGVCFPVLGPSGLDLKTVQDILEHSLLKGVLKISYPPQEVMSHIRNRRARGDATDSQADRRSSFRPWYELYHAIKRVLYTSLPAEERERIHNVLQDFYMREKGLEMAQRTLKIKNRAMLAEARYHGNVARERKPVSGATIIQSNEPAPLSAKTYLAGYGQAVPDTNRPLTLQDYKNIRLPGSEAESGELAETVETSETAQPAFMGLLKETAGKLSISEQLAELELSEEEKQLLSRQMSLGEMLKLESQTVAIDVEPEPSAPITTPAPSEPVTPALPAKSSAVAKVDVLSASQLAQAQDEREKSIQQRLTAAVASQDRPKIAHELVELARYRAGHGRYDSAGLCLEKALSLKPDAGKDTVAEIYRLLGSVSKETFHHNAALSSLTKAAEAIRRLMYEDDTVGPVWLGRLGQVYQDLGEIYAYRKQADEAIEAFQHALRWYGSADDRIRQAEVHFQMAGAYDDARNLPAAIEHYQKALSLDEAQGNSQSAAAALSNLAGLYQEQGQFQQAIQCFKRSLKHDRAVNNLEGQWSTLEAMTSLYLSLEEWEQAETVAKQGLAMALRESAALWQASFYLKLGQLEEDRQQWQAAFKQYQLALSSGASVLSANSVRLIEGRIQAAQSRF